MKKLHDYLTEKTANGLCYAMIEAGFIKSKDDKLFQKAKFGIEAFYSNTLKSVPVILAAMLLGILDPMVRFMCAYALLRMCSYGFHFDNSWFCFIQGSVYDFGSVYISLFIRLNPTQISAAMGCGALLLLIFAPAKTKHLYIKKKWKIITLKILSVGVVAVYWLIALKINNDNPITANILVLAVVLQSINVLPFLGKWMERSRA